MDVTQVGSSLGSPLWSLIGYEIGNLVVIVPGSRVGYQIGGSIRMDMGATFYIQLEVQLSCLLAWHLEITLAHGKDIWLKFHLEQYLD